jgi:hypothetical protein
MVKFNILFDIGMKVYPILNIRHPMLHIFASWLNGNVPRLWDQSQLVCTVFKYFCQISDWTFMSMSGLFQHWNESFQFDIFFLISE